MKRLNTEAKIENMEKVTAFIESELEKAGCSKKQIMLKVALLRIPQ